jgi:predicted enzyme related to lactoylglutathione lyase
LSVAAGTVRAMTAIAVLDTVSVDATDPAALARFYSAVLDLSVADKGDDWAQLAPSAPGAPTVLFLRVPEGKAPVKNRIHLDLRVDDVAAATARCEALGATRITEGVLAGPFTWQVMRDPEGNEFCLCPAD